MLEAKHVFSIGQPLYSFSVDEERRNSGGRPVSGCVYSKRTSR